MARELLCFTLRKVAEMCVSRAVSSRKEPELPFDSLKAAPCQQRRGSRTHLVSTAPLLIGAFAFNFNNFALIYLLTNGGPPLTGYDVPVARQWKDRDTIGS